MIFVGARSITEDRVFALRAFEKGQESEAGDMYTKLTAVYGGSPSEVELLFGAYPSPEGFFQAEPTWQAQFQGDSSFPNGIGI